MLKAEVKNIDLEKTTLKEYSDILNKEDQRKMRLIVYFSSRKKDLNCPYCKTRVYWRKIPENAKANNCKYKFQAICPKCNPYRNKIRPPNYLL